MNTQDLKKENRERWSKSYGITTVDYMDELIDRVWEKTRSEAYLRGYNAGLADGTGKPLLAIEQIREEARKEEK